MARAGHDSQVQISARGDYAVRAALSLAQAYPALMSAQAIAQEQEMPRKFLEAVLADLRRAGVVRAQRGAEGGYTLSHPPRDVAVGQIIRAVDGPLAGVRGLRPEETQYTGAAENLPNLWVAVRAAVREVLDEVSLAELLSGRMPAHVRKLTTRPDAWQPR
ncbi:Rrf2 family transcriptional regulator [Actinoplanes sp. NPDC023714]|uniref:RrF2 family transcriptional regulator n=1 Tax=Actinoplanes sp. NPDC023714 TaxID=3154322 RepID=UPI0033FB9EC0